MRVKDITDRHVEFIKIAKYHGADEQLSQDVAQEMFLMTSLLFNGILLMEIGYIPK